MTTMNSLGIIELWESGKYSMADIAVRMGVSRQRIHQIVKKYKTIKIGQIKKNRCQICGSKENLNYHHIDKNTSNNDKKNIRVLCRDCHVFVHSSKKGKYLKLNNGIIDYINSESRKLQITNKEFIYKLIYLHKSYGV